MLKKSEEERERETKWEARKKRREKKKKTFMIYYVGCYKWHCEAKFHILTDNMIYLFTLISRYTI